MIWVEILIFKIFVNGVKIELICITELITHLNNNIDKKWINSSLYLSILLREKLFKIIHFIF